MNTARCVFGLINLWSLLAVVTSSNPDSEIVQDYEIVQNPKNDQKNERSSDPFTNYNSQSRFIARGPLRDPNRSNLRGIVVTAVRIPYRVFSRFDQRGPLLHGFRNTYISTLIPINRTILTNSSDEGVEFSSDGRPYTSNVPSRTPSNDDKIINRRITFDSGQGNDSVFPEFIIPNNLGKVSTMPDISNFSSQIPSNLNGQDNQADNVPLNMSFDKPLTPNVHQGGVNNHRGYSANADRDSSAGLNTEPSVRNTQMYTRNSPAYNHRKGSTDVSLFAGMVNDFAFNLVRILNLNTNFVISPLSIFTALSMCYLASEGNSKAQIENVLGFNNNSIHGTKVHQTMQNLASLITPASDEFKLFLANGMFLAKNYTINAEFIEDLQRYYEAEFQNLDFGNPELALKVINDWVAKSTQNTIPNFDSSPPSPQTRAILLNAIYFKGIWKRQFPVEGTFQGRFFGLDGNYKLTPTMAMYNQVFPFLRSEEHKHSFIKLPYQGDEISMVIALPNGIEDSPMPAITDRILCQIRDDMNEIRLDSITIPKFRLEFTRSLKRPLTFLGITDVFSANTADLSNMRKEKDLYVSGVHHKAVVEVNEQGTIAAGLTNVNIVPLTYKPTVDFLANHPFAFYIIHERSGLVLFHGKVFNLDENNKPSSK